MLRFPLHILCIKSLGKYYSRFNLYTFMNTNCALLCSFFSPLLMFDSFNPFWWEYYSLPLKKRLWNIEVLCAVSWIWTKFYSLEGCYQELVVRNFMQFSFVLKVLFKCWPPNQYSYSFNVRQNQTEIERNLPEFTN